MKCQCPIAGYCDRHKIAKTPHFHRLCQTNAKYRTAWDEGRGPGQSPDSDDELQRKRAERHARVLASVAMMKRTIDWLLALRIDGETGLGDTITRLLKSPKKIADARERMVGLLKRCSCSRSDAVKKLNQEYRYPHPG